MTSSSILSITTFVYGLAAFLYIASWVFKKSSLGKAATWVTVFSAAGNAAGFVLRWLESYRLGIGHAPLSNQYESLVFFSFVIAIIYIVIEQKYNTRVLGAFAVSIAFLVMAYASLPGINDRIQPLIPALKSNWLIAHVITCFIGYGAFAISFCISIMYLLKHGGSKDKNSLVSYLPELNVLDELTYQMVMFGYLFLTIGIITGAVWANSAWGRYWGWDPKETWSLITWLVYAILLHTRFMRGWQGRRIAFLSIIGFLAVLFTYFGVNLLPGLHSYGAMS
ncbi:MAG: c-type cytochrome biogenesis protein CcsB [Deltaproteobacteria bacterium]|nr:c-type cytochrome biogenesis protein CcsB [Deltaproteobacteria bacterium]MBW1812402.1 c-type cytochrome biogenesis protein CcsB [Deltaproteobacteria bacterium]MBW1846002.1 c-type cytochrome biogenesis protein CcsB [Deltaproteobacteria bacterium]MBW1983753.1 c-type cytochrome biogenesis protein CcsB [Deltaproteobacteria bacterium]MBW2180584.1 c-type cytochrome biogenesis protein CcsB [Deltaproteobacteria bacterium]